MKTVWVCVLLSLFSIVAYSQISAALSGAVEPVGSARLSEYVFLHNTRDESMHLRVAARANVCPE